MKRRLFSAAPSLVLAGPLWAQDAAGPKPPSVALSGVMGQKALLVVAGGAPKLLSPGEVFQGVKLVSVNGEVAVVEIAAQRVSLRVGDAPTSVGRGGGGGGSGSRIVMSADDRGHFIGPGQINGASVSMMVDTGATSVAIGQRDAGSIGVDYRKGRAIMVGTANGAAPAFAIRLETVSMGEVVVRGVEGVVIDVYMPYVLLGNSFLNRFAMRREGDQMTLDRRS